MGLLDFVGDILGGGKSSSSEASQQSQNDTFSSNVQDFYRKGSQTNEYEAQWTPAERDAAFKKIIANIKKNYDSGLKQTSQGMAARGLTGGALATGLSGNTRALNEQVSSAATDVDVEANKKLLKRILTDSSGHSINDTTGRTLSSGKRTEETSNSDVFGDIGGLAGIVGNIMKMF